jgi:hypothetical protein
MMLVHAQTVEAELFAHLQLIEIGVVKIMTHLGIEIGIRIDDPGGFVLFVVIQIETRIGHQVEQKTLHGRLPDL